MVSLRSLIILHERYVKRSDVKAEPCSEVRRMRAGVAPALSSSSALAGTT